MTVIIPTFFGLQIFFFFEQKMNKLKIKVKRIRSQSKLTQLNIEYAINCHTPDYYFENPFPLVQKLK